MIKSNPPFWEEKSLVDMSHDEWESLCDRCGKCCLLKLQDDDEETSVYYTNIACNLFDKESGNCADYQNRVERVSSCVQLTQNNLSDLAWMPASCAYRRVMDGRGLPKWHHLITGNKRSIHDQNQSVLGRVVWENEVDEEDLEEHIVTWPLK